MGVEITDAQVDAVLPAEGDAGSETVATIAAALSRQWNARGGRCVYPSNSRPEEWVVSGDARAVLAALRAAAGSPVGPGPEDEPVAWECHDPDRAESNFVVLTRRQAVEAESEGCDVWPLVRAAVSPVERTGVDPIADGGWGDAPLLEHDDESAPVERTVDLRWRIADVVCAEMYGRGYTPGDQPNEVGFRYADAILGVLPVERTEGDETRAWTLAELTADALCDRVITELIVQVEGEKARGLTSDRVPLARWDLAAAFRRVLAPSPVGGSSESEADDAR